uniref:Uncharacterized protein n=1 Tax=Parascaris univalens TaxID=6257 RepID=A0A915BJG7_PARUN
LLALFVMLRTEAGESESLSLDQRRSEKTVVIKLSREKIVEATCLVRARTCLLNAQVQLKHNDETSAVVLVDYEIFGEDIRCDVYKREYIDFMIKVFLNNCEHSRVKRNAFQQGSIDTATYMKHDPKNHRIFIAALYMGMILLGIYTLMMFLIFLICNEQNLPEEVIDYAEENHVSKGQPPRPTEEHKKSTQQQQLMKSIQHSSNLDHSASNRDVKSQTASSTSSTKQPSKSLIDAPLSSVKKVSDGGRDKSAKSVRSNTKTANTTAFHSLRKLLAASKTLEKEKHHMRIFRAEAENELRSSQKTNMPPIKKSLRELCGSNQQHSVEDLQHRLSFKTVRCEADLTEHIAPQGANAAKFQKNPPSKNRLHGQDFRSHKDYSIWKVKHKQSAPLQPTGNLIEEMPYRYHEGPSDERKSFVSHSMNERKNKQRRYGFKEPEGKSQLTRESTGWNFYHEGGSLKNKDARAVNEDYSPLTRYRTSQPHQ